MADGSSAEYRKKARATVWNVNVQKQQMTRRPEAAAALPPVAPLQCSAPTVKQMATTNVSQQLMMARRPSLSAVSDHEMTAQRLQQLRMSEARNGSSRPARSKKSASAVF
jgi:hypothetical protein